MDPFSELDDFLNDPNDSLSQPAVSETNDVSNFPFDDSPTVEVPKPTTKTKTTKKANTSSKKSNDKEENTEADKKEKFVPGRGQKRIFNKVKRIQDALAVTKKVEEVMNSKTSARSSRQKRTRQRVIHTTSSSESDESEPDGGARAPRQMPNFVNLDSDDEYAEAPISINRNLVSDSAALQASENEEMKVAVKFGLTVEDYMLRPYQKLSELITKVAARKSVTEERIFLMFNQKIISPSSTLHSIEYIKGLVINAYASDQNANKGVSKEKKSKKSDEIELRIQTSMRKQPFVVHIGKSETISSLVFQCAEEFKCDAMKIRLEFDGDLLDSNKTAEEQDLEGGEVIDMFVRN